MGDLLVVAINDDASVRKLKGMDRPINCEQERAALLAGLEAVDFVTVFAEDTPIETLRALRPDILVKGGDYTLDQVVGSEEVISWGGRVTTVPFVIGRSTTRIIEGISRRPLGLAKCIGRRRHLRRRSRRAVAARYAGGPRLPRALARGRRARRRSDRGLAGHHPRRAQVHARRAVEQLGRRAQASSRALAQLS
jgi:rfaE bifunctional protein nucleotidyltransferase chain/domain